MIFGKSEAALEASCDIYHTNCFTVCFLFAECKSNFCVFTYGQYATDIIPPILLFTTGHSKRILVSIISVYQVTLYNILRQKTIIEPRNSFVEMRIHRKGGLLYAEHTWNILDTKKKFVVNEHSLSTKKFFYQEKAKMNVK